MPGVRNAAYPNLGRILSWLREIVLVWMDDEPFNVIEATIGTEKKEIGTCDRIREFVRKVPEINHGVGLL